jgi:hypothetical protein
MRVGPSRIRVAALVFGAAIALHELRYLIAYGEGAGEAQAEQGHGYLPGLEMVALVLLALAGGGLLRALARAWRSGSDEGPGPSFLVTWLAAALALGLIYTGQELVEGMLSSGHPAGLGAILGHGGAVAYALAIPLGAAVALGLRMASTAVQALARRAHRLARRLPPAALSRPRRGAAARVASVLARHLAGRAPPLVP